jgi:hypothetical protein
MSLKCEAKANGISKYFVCPCSNWWWCNILISYFIVRLKPKSRYSRKLIRFINYVTSNNEFLHKYRAKIFLKIKIFFLRMHSFNIIAARLRQKMKWNYTKTNNFFLAFSSFFFPFLVLSKTIFSIFNLLFWVTYFWKLSVLMLVVR